MKYENMNYEAYKTYVFEIMKNDVSQYGYVLGYYIVLYTRSFKVRKFVSQKVFDDLNLKTIEPINKRDFLVVRIEDNYCNTKIIEQIITMLIVSAINNLIFNTNNIYDINILFVILKATLFFYRSLCSMVMNVFIIKLISILRIEIVFKAFIATFEKFNCRRVSLTSRSINGTSPPMLSRLCRIFPLNSTFLRPKIFDTDRIKKFTYNFVNMLKSINMPKILCIFFVIPIFNIGIKYFKIRYKVLIDFNLKNLGIIKSSSTLEYNSRKIKTP